MIEQISLLSDLFILAARIAIVPFILLAMTEGFRALGTKHGYTNRNVRLALGVSTFASISLLLNNKDAASVYSLISVLLFLTLFLVTFGAGEGAGRFYKFLDIDYSKGLSENNWLSGTLTPVVLLLLTIWINAYILERQGIAPANPYENSIPAIGAWASSQLAFALGEEVFYRGFVLGFLIFKLRKHKWGSPFAIVTSSLLFMVQHQSPVSIYFTLLQLLPFTASVTFIFLRFGLLRAVLFHGVYNLVIDVSIVSLNYES